MPLRELKENSKWVFFVSQKPQARKAHKPLHTQGAFLKQMCRPCLIIIKSCYNGILVPGRTSFGLHWRGCKRINGRNIDVDVLNAVKSIYSVQHIHINLMLMYSTLYIQSCYFGYRILTDLLHTLAAGSQAFHALLTWSRCTVCAKDHGLFYLNYPQINKVRKFSHMAIEADYRFTSIFLIG